MIIIFLSEEELKRLNEEVGGSYGAVNFDYNAPPAEEEAEIPAAGQEGRSPSPRQIVS